LIILLTLPLHICGDGGFVNAVGSRKDGEYRIVHLPTPDSLYPWEKLPAPIKKAMENSSKPANTTATVEGVIKREGERNTYLASLAGSMRHRGMPQTAIEVALLDVNQRQCQPPLTEDEVRRIAKSVSRYQPAQPPTTEEYRYTLTDRGNGARFADRYKGKVFYCPERKLWAVYNGKRWEWDQGVIKTMQLAKDTAIDMYREAANESDDNKRKVLVDHARRSENDFRLKAMLSQTQSEPGMAINTGELDSNHWLLNVNNGTLNLKTGKLQPHDPKNLITAFISIDYDPNAQSELWEKFLDKIFESNQAVKDYVQRALGYSITGDQSEQVTFFPYGSGWNGKSTLLDSTRHILGDDYAVEIEPYVFMTKQAEGSGPNEGVAKLYRKRLATSTEIEAGQRLSVSLVKRMTGGEQLHHEKKFEHGFNFQPTHKLWLSGNHKPIITDTTLSIWKRVKLINFNVTISESERIKKLTEVFTSDDGHRRAILAWLVKGCLDWQMYGLQEPPEVTDATLKYREDMDILTDFLNECCEIQPSASIAVAELYRAYKDWCDQNDGVVIGKNKFGNRITEKGVIKDRGAGNKTIWRGIRLLTEDEKVKKVNSVTDFPNKSYIHNLL